MSGTAWGCTGCRPPAPYPAEKSLSADKLPPHRGRREPSAPCRPFPHSGLVPRPIGPPDALPLPGSVHEQQGNVALPGTGLPQSQHAPRNPALPVSPKPQLAGPEPVRHIPGPDIPPEGVHPLRPIIRRLKLLKTPATPAPWPPGAGPRSRAAPFLPRLLRHRPVSLGNPVQIGVASLAGPHKGPQLVKGLGAVSRPFGR